MANVLFTYTTTAHDRSVKTTCWMTWNEATTLATNLLLYCIGNGDISAVWYDNNRPILKRKFFKGIDFFTGEPVVYVEDTEY